MSRQEFYHALDDLDLRVEGWESEAVFDRFAVHGEGQVRKDQCFHANMYTSRRQVRAFTILKQNEGHWRRG